MTCKAPIRATIALGLVVTLIACGPVIRTRGSLLTDDVVARVTVGQSTSDQVVSSLGPPSTVSTFSPNIWYYVGERTEKSAFFPPEVVERRVVRVVFDPAGRVESVDQLSLEDAQEILVVERETPTLGRQVTFMEQLLGNLGRFNTIE
ncbi:MAG: outer membrane protein assembly factor BamE [Pseudomonadota bacterium]